MQEHRWSLGEMENMVPWEREVYVGMLAEHIKEQNIKMQQQRQGM